MFVAPEARGLGLAQRILQELELWAQELDFSFSILETLYKQKEAISLYQKVGYTIVDNYEPYVGLENSICMRKTNLRKYSLCPKLHFFLLPIGPKMISQEKN